MAKRVKKAVMGLFEKPEVTTKETNFAQMLVALHPFAKAAAQFDDCPDTDWVLRLENGQKLTVGDLRKASTAVTKAGNAY